MGSEVAFWSENARPLPNRWEGHSQRSSPSQRPNNWKWCLRLPSNSWAGSYAHSAVLHEEVEKLQQAHWQGDVRFAMQTAVMAGSTLCWGQQTWPDHPCSCCLLSAFRSAGLVFPALRQPRRPCLAKEASTAGVTSVSFGCMCSN